MRQGRRKTPAPLPTQLAGVSLSLGLLVAEDADHALGVRRVLAGLLGLLFT